MAEKRGRNRGEHLNKQLEAELRLSRRALSCNLREQVKNSNNKGKTRDAAARVRSRLGDAPSADATTDASVQDGASR